jgi:hypothetical protein
LVRNTESKGQFGTIRKPLKVYAKQKVSKAAEVDHNALEKEAPKILSLFGVPLLKRRRQVS